MNQTAYNLANYIPVPESGCWLWLGGWDAYGYGKTGGSTGSQKAHRLFYEAHIGPIDDGLVICHKCDTPACVNPSHLFAGTDGDNMADSIRKGRRGRLACNVGSANRSAILTENDVLAIRRSRLGITELAQQYGVRQPTISAVLRRTTWRHVA